MTNRNGWGIGATGRGGASTLLLVFACTAATGACAPAGGGSPAPIGDGGDGGAARPVRAAAAVDTMRPDFPGAAPGERQLPGPVRRAVRQPLEGWTRAWHAALPSLRLDQFERDASLSFAGGDEGPFVGTLDGADLRLLHLAVPSPDVLLVLDPWLDLDLVAGDGGAIEVVLQPEPGVGLVDLRRRRERRLFDLPPGTRVDGAHWIDEQRALVLVDEPARGGRRPVIHLVDVVAETTTRYAGPLAEAEGAALARQELDRRFLAARPALAFAGAAPRGAGRD